MKCYYTLQNSRFTGDFTVYKLLREGQHNGGSVGVRVVGERGRGGGGVKLGLKQIRPFLDK